MRRELLIHNELFFAEILSRIAEGKRPRLRPRGSSMRPFIVSMEVSSPCVATAIPTSVSSVPRRRSWPK